MMTTIFIADNQIARTECGGVRVSFDRVEPGLEITFTGNCFLIFN